MTRDGQLIIELSQRWNEQATVESREAYSAQKPSEIVALIDRLYPLPENTTDVPPEEDDLTDFQQLVRWPSLIETVGVLWDHGAISSEAIFKMWGYSIASAWENWSEPAMLLRKRATYPGTFQFFQALAKAMAKEARRKARRDANREKLKFWEANEDA